MATNIESAVHNRTIIDDPEFMTAFREAIQNPEQREWIISFLETAGLLPSAVRRPA